MSLINDALKKAQNLNTTRPAGIKLSFPRPNTPAAATPGTPGETPPAASAPEAAPVPAAPTVSLPPPRKGKSPHTGTMVAIASVVLVAGVGAIGYVVYALFFMGSPADDLAPAAIVNSAPAATKIAPAAETTPSTAEPTAATPAPSAPTKTDTGKSATTPTTAAPIVAAAETTPTAPAESSAPEVPEIPEVEEPEERINNPKPHIRAWVDKITVSGIRPGDKPKALMNDRVYLIGDFVNRELGLQLREISERLLVFEDPEGNTYDFVF